LFIKVTEKKLSDYFHESFAAIPSVNCFGQLVTVLKPFVKKIVYIVVKKGSKKSAIEMTYTGNALKAQQ